METIKLTDANPAILAQAEEIFKQAHQLSELERFTIPLLEKGLPWMEK